MVENLLRVQRRQEDIVDQVHDAVACSILFHKYSTVDHGDVVGAETEIERVARKG